MLALTPFHAVENLIAALIGRSDALTWVFGSSLLDKSPSAYPLPLLDSTHMLFLLFAVYLAPVLLVRSWLTFNASAKDGLFRVSESVIKVMMLLHNATLALLSAYIVYLTCRSAWRHGYTFSGNMLSLHPTHQLDMTNAIGLFYLSKILEFGDTYIMLLRGNLRQVSFLHVYHHATIFPIWWLTARVAPTGEPFLSAILNSLVHVVMYSYYFFSALGVKRVAAIKRYLTTLQMAQFAVLMTQAAAGLILCAFNLEPHALKHGDYGTRYPAAMSALLFVYMISMLLLFRNFYVADRRRERGIEKSDGKLPRAHVLSSGDSAILFPHTDDNKAYYHSKSE